MYRFGHGYDVSTVRKVHAVRLNLFINFIYPSLGPRFDLSVCYVFVLFCSSVFDVLWFLSFFSFAVGVVVFCCCIYCVLPKNYVFKKNLLWSREK